MRTIRAPAVGIALLFLSSFFILCSDAITKRLLGTLPASEIMMAESLIVIVVLSFVAFLPISRHRFSLKIVDPKGQTLRALWNFAAAIFFILGLPHLTLSVATTASFTSPLFVSGLAPFFLGERVAKTRLAAVAMGFIGILVIAKPDASSLSVYVLFPLACSFCTAMRDITTRRLAAVDRSEATMLSSAIIAVMGCLIWSHGNLVIPDPSDWLLLFAMSLVYLIGIYCTIEAMRYLEANVASSFRYSAILWAVLFDYFFWEVLPAANVLIGVVIVVLSIVFIYRQQQSQLADLAPNDITLS